MVIIMNLFASEEDIKKEIVKKEIEILKNFGERNNNFRRQEDTFEVYRDPNQRTFFDVEFERLISRVDRRVERVEEKVDRLVNRLHAKCQYIENLTNSREYEFQEIRQKIKILLQAIRDAGYDEEELMRETSRIKRPSPY